MSWFSKIARAAIDPLSLAGVGWTNVAEKAAKGLGGGGGGSNFDATPAAAGQTEADINYFRNASRKRGAELRQLSGQAGGYDPTVAARYAQEAEAPIDSGYFQASQGMARKGSSAGVPIGAQMAGQAALSGERMGAKSQARLKAIRSATQEKSDVYSAKRQSILDQLGAEGASLDPQMAYLRAQLSQKQLELQAKQIKDAKNAAMWGGLGQIGGSLVGGMFGGPPGAMAGNRIGGSLGDMWGGLDMNTAPDYFGSQGYM